MKKLSIEEKAKRYDKAFEKVKENYAHAQFLSACEDYQISLESLKNTLESIFPELKESEEKPVEEYNITGITSGYATGKLKEIIKDIESGKVEMDSHDYVEIGGVKWATMNVGAKKITDSGLYFQWGDTQGYTAAQISSEKDFSLRDYKYGNSSSTFTKYNETDGKTVLDSEDDAVTAAWGGNWRMPTKEEFQALVNATTSAWVENYLGSGVNGWFFTSNDDNSKTLFFPAAGYGGGVDVWDVGSDGYYWSRSLYTDGVGNARSLYIGSGGLYPDNDNYRYQGCSVRGVFGE